MVYIIILSTVVQIKLKLRYICMYNKTHIWQTNRIYNQPNLDSTIIGQNYWRTECVGGEKKMALIIYYLYTE